MEYNYTTFSSLDTWDSVSHAISYISIIADTFSIVFKDISKTKILGRVRKYPCVDPPESELLKKLANWKVVDGTFDQTINNRDGYDNEHIYSALTLYIYEETANNDVASKAIDSGTVSDAIRSIKKWKPEFGIELRNSSNTRIAKTCGIYSKTAEIINSIYGDWKAHDAKYSSDSGVPSLILYVSKGIDSSSDSHIHKDICDRLHEMYKKKNSDYGDSFSKLYSEYGLTSVVIRLEDKLNRIRSIAKKGSTEVEDESVKDTLMDLANYAILALIELEKDS